MIKYTLTDIINWAFNIIDNQDLTDTQQLTFLHVINRLNRNFWNSTKISVKKLSAVMQKDPRTVKDAIDFLTAEGLLTKDREERIFIGYYQQLELFENSPRIVKGTARRKSKTTDRGEPPRNSGNGGDVGTENNFSDVATLEIFSGEDIEKPTGTK